MASSRFERGPHSENPIRSGVFRLSSAGPITGGDIQSPSDPGLPDREQELLRVTVARVRPINLGVLEQSRDKLVHDENLSVRERVRKVAHYDRTITDLATYIRFLSYPVNRLHFDNPPRSLDEAKQSWDRRGNYPLVAVNLLGEVVGGLTISDAEKSQHDHWIKKVVVDPVLQDKKIGTQVMYYGIDWAFSHRTHDGRERTKLNTAYIVHVPGWERMEFLLEDTLGFEFRSRLPRQVTVRMGNGKTRKLPSMRWEMEKSKWDSHKDKVKGKFEEHLSSLRDPQTPGK